MKTKPNLVQLKSSLLLEREACRKLNKELNPTTKTPRIIVEVKGGVVINVFASDSTTDVTIYDHDLVEIGVISKKDAAALDCEIKGLTEVA